MSASFAHPPFMPCPECGASVAVATAREHVCNPDRRLDFELFQLRDEIAALVTDVGQYLSSAQGRFEQWYAEHERRQAGGEGPSDELAPDQDSP
jgi:hypothetical protein